MNKTNHIVVFDPIAYAGGSKVATREMMDLINRKTNRITILTADPASWLLRNATIIRMSHPRWLPISEHGKGFWLRQCYFCFWLLYVRLFYRRITTCVGASGPGIDMPIYLLKKLLGYKVTQLIHGPVGLSRSIGLCLRHAEHVFYLQSAYDSLVAAINQTWRNDDKKSQQKKLTSLFNTHHFSAFVNGISDKNQPSSCQYERASVFWAASLLKWKGLDLLLDAIQQMDENQRPKTTICYLKPQNNALPISIAPQPIYGITWHENPRRFNEIRSQHNVFISTSLQEPFGLSILEALSAGMCVIVPSDGAFWDLALTHNHDCLKYKANDVNSLMQRISEACNDLEKIKTIGMAGKQLSAGYRAEQCYLDIKNAIENKPHALLALNEVEL